MNRFSIYDRFRIGSVSDIFRIGSVSMIGSG